MSTHASHFGDFSIYLMRLSEYGNLFGFVFQSSAQRMGFTITRKQNCISAVFDIVTDMMFHSSGFCHSTCRDDHTRIFVIVEHFRLINRFYKFQSLKCKRITVTQQHFLNSRIEILRIAFYDLCGFGTQWTIYKIFQFR